ncbi:hypothetical protein ACFS4T_28890 [Pseudomonas lini]
MVSGGQGMISLTFSRLIAISLPLRKVNSRSESESARALLEDIKKPSVEKGDGRL